MTDIQEPVVKKPKVRHTRVKPTGFIAPPVVRSLVPAINGRKTVPLPPGLTDIDQLVHCVLSNSPNWVLIDRQVMPPAPQSPKKKKNDGQSSARYITLRRRGFDVSVRHVGRVRNYWARWTHDAPEPLLVPTYAVDDGSGYGGVDRVN